MKVYIIIFLGIIGYMFLKSKELPGGSKQRAFRIFGCFYAPACARLPAPCKLSKELARREDKKPK